MKLSIHAEGNKAIINLEGKIDPKANFFEKFRTEFHKLEAAGVREATLKINSVGGSVLQGIKIYNLLEESPIHVTKEVVRLTASMAAVIAAGGKICKYAKMMFHKPFIPELNNANAADLREIAELLENYETEMIVMVSESTNLGADEIRAKYFQEGKDVWLSAD